MRPKQPHSHVLINTHYKITLTILTQQNLQTEKNTRSVRLKLRKLTKMATTHKTSGNNNSHRGKPYALMLLLAFGAAILGVMILHKLREKRIFSLLVKEKDHELLTLHLLFQREQEFNKEAKKKIEDMKTKVYSLRSQKLELDRRLLEMESMIAALRDERKVIESTLEDKKNEIKMLTEEGMNSTFTQVSALKDMVKMKESEIEDLKLRLNKTDFARLSSSITETNKRQEKGHDGQQHINFSDKEMKGENVSQTDGIIQQEQQHLTNTTENSDDMDEDEPRMRQEAALYKWAREQGENTENGGILINTDENREMKATDVQSDLVLNLRKEKMNETSDSHDSPQDQQRRDGVKMEKSDADATGLGVPIRVRRRHRGKRLRDLRNRRLGDGLRSVTTGTGASGNQEDVDSNSQKEESRIDPGQSDGLNKTQEAGRDGQGGGKNEEAKGEAALGRGSTETIPMGTDAEKADDKGNGNENGKARSSSNGKTAELTTTEEIVNNQISEEGNNQTDIDENKKLLKMHNMDINKHNDDSEQKETETEEGEGDDTEDLREPEIDKADIKRFAESDLDEEEAEEAAEETEF